MAIVLTLCDSFSQDRDREACLFGLGQSASVDSGRIGELSVPPPELILGYLYDKARSRGDQGLTALYPAGFQSQAAYVSHFLATQSPKSGDSMPSSLRTCLLENHPANCLQFF